MFKIPFFQKTISLDGSIDRINGELMIKIPLATGGNKFIDCTRGLSRIEGDYLIIPFTDGAAESIGITEGSRVTITNKGGQFTFYYDSIKNNG